MIQNNNLEIWLKRVIDALKLISSSYNEQKNMFPSTFPIADEIALNFYDEVEYQVDYLSKNKIISNVQYQKIKELGKEFTIMSNNKSQDYWSNDALKTSPSWEKCRMLAQEILKDFN